MTTVCYHHRAEKANICAMFLSYQCFRERWRSLGESNSCFRRERVTTNDPSHMRVDMIGGVIRNAAMHPAASVSVI
jgi:hypothetical protein